MKKIVEGIEIEAHQVDALTQYASQFITAERFERIRQVASKRTHHVAVVLENLFQGHNASAVLRTCDCFGIQKVMAIENVHRFQPNEEIALGAEKWLDITHYKGEEAVRMCYQELRSQGYRIAATTPHGNPVAVDDMDLSAPVALVFGTEKDGLSHQALSEADFTVALPMYGFTESFNISVSAALFLQKAGDLMQQFGIQRGLHDEDQRMLELSWILKTVKDPHGIVQNFLKISQ